ncbi:MAG: hypothetical protein Q9210_004213 [Variospora velana]
MTSHYYQPLPPIAPYGVTPSFTRLMLVFAGSGSDPLVCSLTVVDIENTLPYEALSYVWGRDLACRPLWCDGGLLQIRPNLDTALRFLRLPSHARRLWVDAICIDQGNVDERTRQVQYMRLVYKYAARTIVWLGLKSPGIDEVFRLAQVIAEIKDADRESNGAVSQPAKVHLPELDIITEIFEANTEAVHRLTDFFNRDYFVRIWCVQEVVVSRWCVAKCEDLEIDFMVLLSTIINVNMRRTSMFAGRPLEFWNMIYMLKQPGRSNLPRVSGHAVEGSVGSLENLLIGTRDFLATDARDKIFSLLGISDEGLMPVLALSKVMHADRNSLSARFLHHAQRGLTSVAQRVNNLGPGIDLARNQALKADYNQGVVEVYRAFTRFMMRKSPRMLDILSHVQHLDNPLSDSYPSWVPKWFQPRSASLIGGIGCFLAGLCDGHFPYFALLHDSPLSGKSIRPDILSLDGYQIDRVKSVSQLMNIGVLEELPIEASWDHLVGTPFSTSFHTYRNGEMLQMAFCKSLAAGCLGAALHQGFQLSHSHPNSNHRTHFTRQSHSDAAAYVMSRLDPSAFSYPGALASLREAASSGSLSGYVRAVQAFSYNRKVYLTQNGFLGIGPSLMNEGDEICVLFGGRVPFALRRMPDHHVLIGETYIYDEDIMWGKLTEAVRFRNQLPIVTFEIR